MTAINPRVVAMISLVPALVLLLVAAVDAQGDAWSFFVTPQVWVTHIESNGFSSPGVLGGILLTNPNNRATVFTRIFETRDSSHVGTISPQVGIQVAAQKQRWTLAGSFQYVEFTMRNDIVFAPPISFAGGTGTGALLPGDVAARESVTTQRFDMDLAASYAFPDLVRNWLDVSVGGGFKFIYADATRHYADVHPALAGPSFGGLYTVCAQDTCEDSEFVNHATTKAWLYGVTFPTSAVLRLTNDSKWLLSLSASPFLGAETRDDRKVVYALTPDVSVRDEERVKRLDGTTFAYGATADLAVRYVFDAGMLAYAGMRVQYIQGHEKYLAYGPLFGMSFRLW